MAHRTKQSTIGLTPIGQLMGREPRAVTTNRREAMLAQGKVDPQAFPVGNRAARRLAASSKAKEKPL
jgi:hypothetical protein